MTEDQDPWTEARETDQRVRIAAFEFLRSQTQLRGEVLPRGLVGKARDHDAVMLIQRKADDVAETEICRENHLTTRLFQGARILSPTRRGLQPDRDFLAER